MATIAVVVALLLLLAWFFWPSPSRPHVDENELERAEREVQEAPNDETVRDWGPGAGQKPL